MNGVPRPIFLHGAGGTRTTWTGQERRFEGSLSLPLPGHPDGEGMDSAGAYAEWVIGELERIPGPRALVGHSLGGAVAMEVALRRPDLVEGIVLVATGACLPVPDHAIERARTDFRAECERVVRASLVQPDEALVGQSIELMQSVGQETLLGDYAACRGHDLRDRLGEIGAPALVLCGAEDPLTPLWMGEELARGLPSALMVVVPEASHLPMVEQAGTVNLVLAAYLARLELTLAGA